MRKILIISHSFPPNPGIGGRRWVKFAKYLKRSGHEIYILCAENIHSGCTAWLKDAKELNIEYLPYEYPKILSSQIGGISDKIKYRFALAFVRLSDKGNYYDKTIFWKKQIEEKVSFYIRNKSINTVIVTGAPFRLTYFVSALKKRFDNVTFISDFRDSWTQDTELTALSSLDESRIDYEKFCEQETVLNSDYIFTVAEPIQKYFAGLSQKNNCVLIPNGFDRDDFPANLNEESDSVQKEQKVNFVFSGTLYANLDYILDPFFKALAEIKNSRPDLYHVLNFEFIGKFPENYKHYIRDQDMTTVKVHGEKPSDFVYAKLQKAHYGVLFLNNVYNYSFSTKFCEYLGMRKKIVVVSNGGSTADFVLNNNLGRYFPAENPINQLINSIEAVINVNFKIELNTHFDADQFSIETISNKMETIFSQIEN